MFNELIHYTNYSSYQSQNVRKIHLYS